MTLKPLADHLLVEPIVEETSRGGIFIPESIRSEFNSGPKLYRVLAVGPGRLLRDGVTRVPIECSPGDRVLCHSYDNGPMPLENGQKIIPENQVLLVIPNQPTHEEKEPL